MHPHLSYKISLIETTKIFFRDDLILGIGLANVSGAIKMTRVPTPNISKLYTEH